MSVTGFPEYTTGTAILDEVASQLGVLDTQQFLGDAPHWQKIVDLAADRANVFCHKKVMAVLGLAAAVLSDAGMSIWAGRVGCYFALLAAAPFNDTINLAAVKELSSVLEEGDNWIPILSPSGELGASRIVTVGTMDTFGDVFKLTDQS